MSREVRPGCLMCDSLYVKAAGSLPCWTTWERNGSSGP